MTTNYKKVCRDILRKYKLGEELEEIGGYIYKNGTIKKVSDGYGKVNIIDEEVGIPEDVIGTFHTHPFSGISEKAPRKLDFSNEDIEEYKKIDQIIPCLDHIVVGEDGCIVWKCGKKIYIKIYE